MFIQRTIEIVVIEKGHTFFVPGMMQRLSDITAMLWNLNTIVFYLLKKVTSTNTENGCGRFSPVST